MSRVRHLKTRVPSPSLLPSNLGSHMWREQNHEVARTWILESLAGDESLPIGIGLGVREKQLALC